MEERGEKQKTQTLENIEGFIISWEDKLAKPQKFIWNKYIWKNNGPSEEGRYELMYQMAQQFEERQQT